MRRKLFLPAYFILNTGKILEHSFSKRMSVAGLNFFIGGFTVFSLLTSMKRLKAAKKENFDV